MKKIINYDKNEIKQISLLSIITDYISDKKNKITVGYIYENCPFCPHKNHFMVNIKENLYHSYSGCCKGGDVIHFFMEIENLSFQDSVKILGDRFNLAAQSSKTNQIYSAQEKNRLSILDNLEKMRSRKNENLFFEHVKEAGLDEILQKGLELVGNEALTHYICNLKYSGMINIPNVNIVEELQSEIINALKISYENNIPDMVDFVRDNLKVRKVQDCEDIVILYNAVERLKELRRRDLAICLICKNQ